MKRAADIFALVAVVCFVVAGVLIAATLVLS